MKRARGWLMGEVRRFSEIDFWRRRAYSNTKSLAESNLYRLNEASSKARAVKTLMDSWESPRTVK